MKYIHRYLSSESCYECLKDAFSYVLEYHIYDKVNIKRWYCDRHKPPYDVTYKPKENFNDLTAYKKFVSLHGINYAKPCNSLGEVI